MDAKKPIKPTGKIAKTPSLPKNNPRDEEKLSKLSLDEDAVRPARTRGEMYQKLRKESELEDIYELPSDINRLLALLLDLSVIGFFAYTVNKMSFSMTDHLIRYLSEKQNIVINLPFNITVYLIMGIIIFLFLLFYLVVTTFFFNKTLGKKIFGLNVRGDESFTLSLNQVIERELFWKPISIATMLGFVFPFFDKKKRKSLHDRIVKTHVVKD